MIEVGLPRQAEDIAQPYGRPPLAVKTVDSCVALGDRPHRPITRLYDVGLDAALQAIRLGVERPGGRVFWLFRSDVVADDYTIAGHSEPHRAIAVFANLLDPEVLPVPLQHLACDGELERFRKIVLLHGQRDRGAGRAG